MVKPPLFCQHFTTVPRRTHADRSNCTNDEQQAATTLNQSVLCGSVPTSGGGGGSGRPVGAIVGGTVGGIAFLVLLAVLLFFCLKRRARERRDSKDQNKTSEKRKTGVMDFLAGRGSRSERGLSDENQVSAGLEGDEYQPSPFSYLDSTQAEGLTGAAAVAAAATGAGVGNRDSLPASEKTESPSAAVFVASTDTRPSFEWNTTSSNTHPATRRHRVQKNSSIAKHGQQGGVPVGETPAAAGHPLPGTPTRRFVQHEDSGEVV